MGLEQMLQERSIEFEPLERPELGEFYRLIFKFIDNYHRKELFKELFDESVRILNEKGVVMPLEGFPNFNVYYIEDHTNKLDLDIRQWSNEETNVLSVTLRYHGDHNIKSLVLNCQRGLFGILTPSSAILETDSSGKKTYHYFKQSNVYKVTGA